METSQGPGIAGIAQFGIPAKDIGRAADFYRDKLGLPLLMKAQGMAFFDCGGVRLYIDANPTGTEAGGNTFLYLRANDIQAAHAAFRRDGVEIHREPAVIARLPRREVWLMWIRDSESNLIGVMQERAVG